MSPEAQPTAQRAPVLALLWILAGVACGVAAARFSQVDWVGMVERSIQAAIRARPW
jgi:hypothetical protein